MNSCLNHIENWPELAHGANYCVAKLAKRCGISSRQLRRFIVKTKGKSPHQWLGEMRMRRAVELLRDDALVKKAAGMIGYAHPAHFSRDFKKHYGMPPKYCANWSLAESP